MVMEHQKEEKKGKKFKNRNKSLQDKNTNKIDFSKSKPLQGWQTSFDKFTYKLSSSMIRSRTPYHNIS